MPFLLIDKPVDWTSHDVVGFLRKVTKIRKIGHAGTLDPFATGLLIVAIERSATKRLDEFKALKKSYDATIQLGATSDTQDITGVIQETMAAEAIKISEETIQETLNAFIGKQQQTPPMYSAKKIKGKKLYELAREGKIIERQPNDIEIFDLKFNEYDVENKQINISVNCSVGTYIRTLCHDIGARLGTGAYCATLRRTAIGPYSVEDASPVKEMSQDTWQNACFDV